MENLNLDFLLDNNIVQAELVYIEDENGNETPGVSLIIGDLEKLSCLTQEEIESSYSEQEIILTKKQLNKLIKLLKDY